MVNRGEVAHVVEKLHTYPYIMATGSTFKRIQWMFERDGAMAILEMYENLREVTFHEFYKGQIKTILDIQGYVEKTDITNLLENSKTNYYKNKRAIRDISVCLGEQYGIAFDEYRWLQKEDSRNYIKVCLFVFRNPDDKSIQVEYCQNGNMQQFLLSIIELMEFLRNTKVFKPTPKKTKTAHKEVSKSIPIKEKPDVEKLSEQLDCLFVRNSKEYNLYIQSCKSPPDEYAYLLKDE